MAPRARQAKNKARIKAYEQMSAEKFEDSEDEFEIQIPPGKHLGDLVVEAKGISKGYGDQLLIDNLSFRLPAGGIVGVIGPNGAGKTTLFRMMVGQEKPDERRVARRRRRSNWAMSTRTATRSIPKKPSTRKFPAATTCSRWAAARCNARAYVARFNFQGHDQQKLVGTLSGGERNRVHLAKLLRRGSNVLLLDEPTNDLDVDTLRALEEAILNFAGCVVVISHDRWFLDRMATHILAFEGDGYVHWCEGNFATYSTAPRPAGHRRRPAAPHSATRSCSTEFSRLPNCENGDRFLALVAARSGARGLLQSAISLNSQAIGDSNRMIGVSIQPAGLAAETYPV